MTNIRDYIRAESPEQAYELIQKKTSRIIGGFLWLRLGNGTIGTAVDLCDLGLNHIEEDSESFRIGAYVTLREFELHEGLNRYTAGAAAEAVKNIVGVQFRNTATVGGSVWGRFGFSDVLTFLLSTDCSVELFQAGTVPLEEFINRPPDRDVLTHIVIRKTPGIFAYRSMRIQRTDFPVITCASSFLDGELRTSVGARPARAMLLRKKLSVTETGSCAEITEEAAHAFALQAASGIPVAGNLRGSADYRKQLISVLTKRNLLEIGGML